MDYCERTDLEAIFGVTNVGKWADLDGDEDATKIAARIASKITQASAEIDARLRRSRYAVPLSPMDPVVEELAATMAGLRLAEARGNEDSQADLLAGRREWVKQTFQDILRGSLQLEASLAVSGTNVPKAFS